jgi:hypothetical protein
MVDIKKIIEAQRQLDDMSGASKAQKALLERFDTRSLSALSPHRDLMTEISRNQLSIFANSSSFQDSLRLAQKSVSQLALENFQGFQNSSIQSARKLIEETFQPFLRNDFLSDQLKSNFEYLRESLLSPYQSRSSEFLRSFEQATKATAFSSLETLSKSFAEKANLFGNEDFLRQISKSLIGYDQFANDTLARFRSDIDKNIASALRGSLILANEQVLRSTSVVQSYIEDSDVSNFTDSNLVFDREFPRVNRYRIQRQELLRRDDVEEDEDYENLVIKSPSAISFDLIVNCLKFVGMCNETSQTTKGDTIFTITNSVYSNSFKLLQVVPTDKEKFAEIVDYLNFILIEGAGGKFLRFVDYKDGQHFGYFANTEPEVEIIWKIKHLRNKWLRHDIEHGQNTKKDYQIRKETLEWFGMQKVPQSKEEFIFLYNNLMLRVEEFLKLLLERVSKFSN